ncbi:MAG TPA: response regulator [Candidatus Angelobacter sp.]|nr:response regulator [Candidatus Angelobacter sp.]
MKKHILVVDDDSSIRQSLQKILKAAGYDVTTAPDGASAEDLFGKADLLVLDLNLPIQDGWDVLGHVNAEHPLLPVIVVTGLADQLDEQTIPGASAFLEKPIEVPSLLKTIESLVNQTHEERVKEFDRRSEPWQPPLTYAGHIEHKKKGRAGFRRFRSAQ